MKSCPNVHVYWSSHRVPVSNVLIDRVPVEFPITFLGISFQSIFLFTRVSKIETTKGYTNGNTIKTKVHGSNDQKIAEEEPKILCARFRSNWIKNLCSANWRKFFYLQRYIKELKYSKKTKIGDIPEISINAARKLATLIKADNVQGKDPIVTGAFLTS